MTPALLTIDEAAATLRCSRRAVFRLVANGDLVRAPRIGKRTCVFAESVFRFLEKAYDPPAPKVRRTRRRADFDARVDQLVADVRAGTLR